MASFISGGEIINLHLGGCGGNIAAAFWQILCKEHHLVTFSYFKHNEAKTVPAPALRITKMRNKLKKVSKTSCRRQSRPNPKGSIQLSESQHLLAQSSGTACTMQNLNIFFDETMHRYVPRAIFIDQDPVRLNSRFLEFYNPLTCFFRRENFVFGRSGSKGIYTNETALDLQQILRHTEHQIYEEMEKTDALQGFQLTNHLGGGCGSSLASACLHLLRDEIGTKATVGITSLFPSFYDVSSHRNGIEFYNCLLALPDLAEHSDLTFILDNDALHDICFRLISLHEPGWTDLNHIVATSLSALTSCMRFPQIKETQEYASSSYLHLRDLPFLLGDSKHKTPPFILPGFSPLAHRGGISPQGYLIENRSNKVCDTLPHFSQHLCDNKNHPYGCRHVGTRMPSVKSLCQSLFRPSHFLASVDPLGHYYINTLVVLRGKVSYEEIVQELAYARVHGNAADEEWSYCIPRDLFCKFCPVPSLNLNLSAFFGASSTAIGLFLEQLANQYEKLLSRRAFLHVFHQQEIEEAELYQKLEDVRLLISHYETAYAHLNQEAIEYYQAKRDMSEIPFHWDVTKCQDMIFNTKQPVRVRT